jgi:hypothetical protein
MGAKTAALELIAQLADEVTFGEIITALQERLATEEALRRFDERGGIPDEDVTHEEWMAMLSRSFADDLNDPRADIYSMEDGVSTDESR